MEQVKMRSDQHQVGKRCLHRGGFLLNLVVALFIVFCLPQQVRADWPPKPVTVPPASQEPYFFTLAWPKPLVKCIVRETVYGDGKLGEGERLYVARRIHRPVDFTYLDEPEPWMGKKRIKRAIKTSAVAFEMIDFLDASPALYREIAHRTPATVKEAKKWHNEAREWYARLGKKYTTGEHKARVESIVEAGGDVRVGKSELDKFLPYFLLRSKSLTPKQWEKFVLANPHLFRYMVDALKVAEDPLPYAEVFWDRIDQEAAPLESVPVFGAVYKVMTRQNMSKFIEAYNHAVPNTVTLPGDEYYDKWYRLCRNMPVMIFRKCKRYRRYKDDKKALVKYMSRKSGDNEWLLYRYHPDLLSCFVRRILGAEVVVRSSEQEYDTVPEALQMVQVYPGFSDEYKGMLAKIRSALESDDPVTVANALYIVPSGGGNIQLLEKLVTDKRKLPGEGTEDGSTPIGVMAIYAISRSYSERRSAILRRFATDEGVRNEIRDAARHEYGPIEDVWLGEAE